MNWEDAFWVVDLEGNGATPPEMVELALVEVRALVPTGRRKHWLVRPAEPISATVSRIHGIGDADLAGAPAFDDIADDVLALVEGVSVVGHSVRVELDVLGRALPGWSPVAAIDTLAMARTLRPGLPGYGLTKLASSLALAADAGGIERWRPHSAPYDAALTADLFAKLLGGLPASERSGALDEANVLTPRQGLLL